MQIDGTDVALKWECILHLYKWLFNVQYHEIREVQLCENKRKRSSCAKLNVFQFESASCMIEFSAPGRLRELKKWKECSFRNDDGARF